MKTKKKFKMNLGLWTLIAAVLGIVAGLIFKSKTSQITWINDIFMRLLQMAIIPFVMGAVIGAVGSVKPKELGRMGGKIFILFAVSTLIAAFIGILCANIFKPGVGIDISQFSTTSTELQASATLSESLLNLVPVNIIQSMANGETIKCLVFSLLFGVVLSLTGAQKNDNTVLKGIRYITEALQELLKLIVHLIPVSVFIMMAYAIGTIGTTILGPMAKLIMINLVAAIVITGGYSLLACAYAHVSVIKFWKKMGPTIMIAAVSQSSSVSLPTKMDTGERQMGISPRVNRLVGPLGMSMNSDGAALFIALSAITVAQIFGIHMTFLQQFSLVITATLTTFATVSVAGGGLIMFAMVLAAVGLPPEGYAFIAGIDFVLAIIRTILNVVDDVIIALVIAASEKGLDREIFNGEKEYVNI